MQFAAVHVLLSEHSVHAPPLIVIVLHAPAPGGRKHRYGIESDASALVAEGAVPHFVIASATFLFNPHLSTLWDHAGLALTEPGERPTFGTALRDSPRVVSVVLEQLAGTIVCAGIPFPCTCRMPLARGFPQVGAAIVARNFTRDRAVIHEVFLFLRGIPPDTGSFLAVVILPGLTQITILVLVAFGIFA